MWFAIVACLASAILVFLGHRANRGLPASEPVDRALAELRCRGLAPNEVGAYAEDERRLRELLRQVANARSRARAVAAINEFTLEAQSDLARGVGVAGTLARAGLSLGVLLGALSLAQVLTEATSLSLVGLTPAVVCVGAGGLGCLWCLQIGRWADARRARYRDRVARLSKALQHRLPREAG